jgi:hypothetical protein
MAGMYHEPVDELTPRDRDITRALMSLKEEIEAIDWYNQRAASSSDESIRGVLIHNRNEEIEHACMMIEWLRRTMPEWDEELRTYLFTEGPIDELEEEGEEGGEEGEKKSDGSLGIGKMK